MFGCVITGHGPVACDSATMNPLKVACFLLAISGEILADYEVQPVDAVLYIDGAPTYLRLINSTSLENVYNCVLENSKNVNSVIMAAQLKGVQLDVGQLEENANDAIRRLSASAERTGRTLWKSPEELQMFKTRLARYLSMNYHDKKPIIDSDSYLNIKSQRSADWLHTGVHRGNPSFHPYQRWGETPFATQEPRRHHFTSEVRSEVPFYSTPSTMKATSLATSTPGLLSSAPECISSNPKSTGVPANETVLTGHLNFTEGEPPHQKIDPSPAELTTEGGGMKMEDIVTEVSSKIPETPEMKKTHYFSTLDLSQGNETKRVMPRVELETAVNQTSAEDDLSNASSKSSEETNREDGDRQKKKRRKGKKKNVKKSTSKGRKRRRPTLE